MVLTSLMAATFFNVPIAPPPHVVLRAVDPLSAESQTYKTTTPDLLPGFSPGDQVSGSWFATLPQPIYPPPASSGGQGKSTPTTVPSPAPSPAPSPPPTQESTENWADRIWRRYKGGSN